MGRHRRRGWRGRLPEWASAGDAPELAALAVVAMAADGAIRLLGGAHPQLQGAPASALRQGAFAGDRCACAAAALIAHLRGVAPLVEGYRAATDVRREQIRAEAYSVVRW